MVKKKKKKTNNNNNNNNNNKVFHEVERAQAEEGMTKILVRYLDFSPMVHVCECDLFPSIKYTEENKETHLIYTLQKSYALLFFRGLLFRLDRDDNVIYRCLKKSVCKLWINSKLKSKISFKSKLSAFKCL